MSIEKCADAVFESVRNYLEKRLQELPAPRDGKDGADGTRGEKGLDGAPGRDGLDGKDGPAGPEGPPGKDGARGRDGIDGAKGLDGAQGLPGADGAPGLAGTKGLDGEPGRDGRDGPPGRDAAQIDILPAINEERSYARGTFASHKGGLWRATRATEGMDGWECIVDGDHDDDVLLADDNRTFTFRKIKSSGRVIDKSFVLPVVLDCGIFKEGTEYLPGDGCTWGGSFWIAQKKTMAKPDSGDGAFRLAVKRGRDGKDGPAGKQGDKGLDGRAGRDLTQMLADGRKF